MRQRKVTSEVQEEGSVQNWPCWSLDLRLAVSRMVRKDISALKPAGLWLSCSGSLRGRLRQGAEHYLLSLKSWNQHVLGSSANKHRVIRPQVSALAELVGKTTMDVAS